MNIEIIKNRKGAQKAVDIPSEVLSLLNTGSIETVNLTEWLAVDHSQLVKTVFPTFGIDKNVIGELVCQIDYQKKPSSLDYAQHLIATIRKRTSRRNANPRRTPPTLSVDRR